MREMTLCCSHEEDGEVVNTYLLELTVVLKADSVEEMPYYQGAANYCETMTASLGRLRTEDSRLRVDMLSSKQTELYDELEEYIGKEQKLTFHMRESYPSDNETQKEILFENGFDYLNVNEMLPDAEQRLRQCGYAAVAYEDAQYLKQKESAAMLQSRASYAYEVSEAVSYMRKYTSNPAVCEVCGKEAGPKEEGKCEPCAAPSKYNKNYSHYADSHSDCANYVSQALCEGGIPTDSTWKPGSDTWVGVSKLITYMCNNGYGTSVSYKAVQRGDLIKWTGSHVTMITSFDGVTYEYSGHTRDRLDEVLKERSKYTYYRIG